jgi:hypothetical protein
MAKNEIAGALCVGDFFRPRFPAHAWCAVNTAPASDKDWKTFTGQWREFCWE